MDARKQQDILQRQFFFYLKLLLKFWNSHSQPQGRELGGLVTLSLILSLDLTDWKFMQVTIHMIYYRYVSKQEISANLHIPVESWLDH